MSQDLLNFEKYRSVISARSLIKDVGKVTRVTGYLIEGYLPDACLGSLCSIYPGLAASSTESASTKTPGFFAEVVGFRDKNILMMPFGDPRGVAPGSRIILGRSSATVSASSSLLGRVLNGLGEPIDGGPQLDTSEEIPIYTGIRNPLERPPIETPLDLGVRAINGLLTVGQGQRVGIMAGSGVGKSVLMGMMARSTKADVNVIALIGERGREVREFIEKDLGPEGLKRSIVVVATSDQSPLLRMRGAFVATAIAEYFCSQNLNVLLMMDSVTRFAMAQREIGLSSGEPPSSKGYTPSVFSTLPKLLERAGRFEGKGSITGLYTVLVEGDDMDDPIADSVRSIVDGHIVLSRRLAQRGHFPAIDILQSTSRVMRSIVSPEQTLASQVIRENLSVYREAEDLINIGAYKKGANPRIDLAIELNHPIEEFLRQDVDEKFAMTETLNEMSNLTQVEIKEQK